MLYLDKKLNIRLLRKKLKLSGWIYIYIISLTAFIPSSIHPRISLPPFYSKLLPFILVFLGFLLLIINFLITRNRFEKQWSFIALCLFFVGIVGTFTNKESFDINYWIALIWPMIIFIGIPFLSNFIVKQNFHFRENLLEKIAYIVTFIAFVYTIAIPFVPKLGFRRGEDVMIGGERLYGPIGNPAIIYIIFLPTAAYWLKETKKGNKKAWIGVFINIMATILTFSRAAILSLIIWAFCLFLLKENFTIKKKLKVALLLIIISISLFHFGSNKLTKRIVTLDFQLRKNIFYFGWNSFLEDPILGKGFSHVWPWWVRHGQLGTGLLDNLRDGRYLNTKYGLILWNPHNIFVLFAVETGILGLFFLIVFFGLPIIHARKTLNKELLIALLTVLFIDCFSAGTFYAFPAIISIWWIYILTLAIKSKTSPKN